MSQAAPVLKCDKGHTLQHTTDPYPSRPSVHVTCDRCSECIPAAQADMHCEQCHFDMCASCAAKAAQVSA